MFAGGVTDNVVVVGFVVADGQKSTARWNISYRHFSLQSLTQSTLR